jgi:hypothetical protein
LGEGAIQPNGTANNAFAQEKHEGHNFLVKLSLPAGPDHECLTWDIAWLTAPGMNAPFRSAARELAQDQMLQARGLPNHRLHPRAGIDRRAASGPT